MNAILSSFSSKCMYGALPPKRRLRPLPHRCMAKRTTSDTTRIRTNAAPTIANISVTFEPSGLFDEVSPAVDAGFDGVGVFCCCDDALLDGLLLSVRKVFEDDDDDDDDDDNVVGIGTGVGMGVGVGAGIGKVFGAVVFFGGQASGLQLQYDMHVLTLTN